MCTLCPWVFHHVYLGVSSLMHREGRLGHWPIYHNIGVKFHGGEPNNDIGDMLRFQGALIIVMQCPRP